MLEPGEIRLMGESRVEHLILLPRLADTGRAGRLDRLDSSAGGNA
ncbi:MAG TPA: hypothetical protein V6C98_07785 [Thermosynechococcaceae cyanobacterium]